MDHSGLYLTAALPTVTLSLKVQLCLTVRKSQTTIQRKRCRMVAITLESTVPSRDPLNKIV